MVGKVMLLVLVLILALGGCGIHEETVMSSADSATEESSFLAMELLEESVNLTDELQEKAKGAIVQIVSGNLLGSGVIFSMNQEQVVIVTAAHVLEEISTPKEDAVLSVNDSLEIKLVDGTVLTQENGTDSSLWQVRLSQSSDIGFISVPVQTISMETLALCRYVAVDKKALDQLQPGDAILVLGSVEAVADKTYEGSLSESWVYMEDYEQYMMLGRMDAQPGMSGCGVFDKFGRLVGILSGEDGKGNLAIVPLSLILSEW